MSELVSLIRNAQISLPVTEVILLVITLSVCLGNKWSKSGLVVAYVFAYRWGWMFFAEQSQGFFLTYLILGGLVLILSVYDMLSLRYRD